MITWQHHPTNSLLPVTKSDTLPSSRMISVLRFLVVTYLLGMVVLSVEQFLLLPQNLALVDFWNILFFPICWLYIIRIRQAVRFPFALGMWLILLGSFIGTFFAFNATASFIVILKEVYLYGWFVTVTAIFASLKPGILRRILRVWLMVVILHGCLLVAEFVLPNFYAFMISTLGKYGQVYVGRPSGLFENPVWAALFQLMGFVPLLLGGIRRTWSLFVAVLLVLSILAAASLAALVSLLAASAVAVLILLLIGGNLKFLAWLTAVVCFAGVLVIFTIDRAPAVLSNLEHLTTDRAEHTAEERLFLWGGGTEVLFSQKSILGIGLNNYRDFLENKTLHNDILEFGVERGVIGLLGLVLLAGEAVENAVRVLLKQVKNGDLPRPSGVIFLAMLVAIFLVSNAHQIFHYRTVWLGLALLEATFFKLMSPSIKMTVTRQVDMWNKRFKSPGKPSPETGRHESSPAESI